MNPFPRTLTQSLIIGVLVIGSIYCNVAYTEESFFLYDVDNGAKKEWGARKVDIGVVDVGQVIYAKTYLINKRNKEIVVDKLTVCCGNAVPTIDKTIIEPGGQAKITQKIHRRKPGDIEIKSVIRLKEPKAKQLTIIFRGKAIQSIRSFVGWEGKKLSEVDYSKDECRIGSVHSPGKNLIASLVLDKVDADTQVAAFKLQSKYFKVKRQSLKIHNDCFIQNDVPRSGIEFALECKNPDRTCSQNGSYFKKLPYENPGSSKTPMKMYITLSPNADLPEGEFTDKLCFAFKDERKCYVTIAFRVVGDVYGESSTLNMGMLHGQENIKKEYTIYFSEEKKVWNEIKYVTEGQLADAISISENESYSRSLSRQLIVEIDCTLIPSSALGFVSTNIDIFEANNKKNHVSVLAYGIR